MLKIAVGSLCIAGLLTMGACSARRTPDVSDSIRKSLDQAGYKDVSVSQDRDKGVVNLTGHVPTEADRQQAESIAKANAAGDVVADQVAVLPPGNVSEAKTVNSDLDGAIKKNLDAAFVENHLKDVHYSVKNGVVKLTGKVDSQATRSAAGQVATNIPDVRQVVNELEVKYDRATSSR